MDTTYQLLASLVCGSPLDLGKDIAALERGGMDAIHFDVMDGTFVPRLGLYPELLAAVKKVTKLPVDVHMMVEEPERYVSDFAHAGADMISVHAESTPHVHRALRAIRAAGCKAGLALNPATPLSALDYVLTDIEYIVLMVINPGVVGHKLIPSMMAKIADTKRALAGFPHIRIEIDGGVTPESAPHMLRAGADMLVCGTSSVFRGDDLAVSAKKFRSQVEAELSNAV